MSEILHTKINDPKKYAFENAGYDHPFRIKSNGRSPEKISISKYSNVFSDFSLGSSVPIAGLECPITIVYGNKIWLETFFDKNLNPICSVVKVGNKWPAKVANTSNPAQLNDVYPSELEFISKYDIQNKISEINETISRVAELKALAIDNLDYEKYFSLITEREYSDLVSRADTDYDDITESLTSLASSLNNYFSAAPTSIWKKLFRTYTMIGYSTKNPFLGSAGISFNILNRTQQTNPDTPTASKSDSYRVIQSVITDLVIVDICYQNRFPAKIALPTTRGVSYYSILGEEEESINTE